MPARRLRLDRPAVAAAHDLTMAAASFVLALWLRLGRDMWWQTYEFLLPATLLFTVICGAAFWRFRLYQGVWRYASLPDLAALLKAVTLAHLVFLMALFLMTRLELYPRSALVINWFVLVALLGGPRFVYRLVKDGSLARVFERTGAARVPVLLAGTGDAAEQFARAMARSDHAAYDVVGYIAANPAEVGRRIRGIEVAGTLADLPGAVARLRRRNQRPQRLILAADGLDPAAVRSLVDEAERLGLALARLGPAADVRAGDAAPEVRPVPIEDLLGRPQHALDRAAVAALVRGRRVLVTGAGGTIGGELARQAAALEPAALVLLDASEHALYAVDLELAESLPAQPRTAVLADVRDRKRLDAVFAVARPELVFHAAALKHVPIAEVNAGEAVLTNVVGTRNVLEACRAHGAGTMVLVSTDKAVNPAGVMGLSKRVAEVVCQAVGLSESRRPGGTRVLTVRFGNVLGSTGSVVPLFQRQLARGGPLTVTHLEATRFLMTVREAVELVLQAAALPVQGGAILVLDMGQPVRIADLARRMIRLAGRVPDDDVKIVVTGLRPGEKLHEELLHADERASPTACPGIVVAEARAADLALLVPRLQELEEAARAGRDADAVHAMRILVPEFHSFPRAHTA